MPDSDLSEVPDLIHKSGLAKVINIDSSFFPERNGSTSAELAYSLSLAVFYLRKLEEKDLEIKELKDKIKERSKYAEAVAPVLRAARTWSRSGPYRPVQ